LQVLEQRQEQKLQQLEAHLQEDRRQALSAALLDVEVKRSRHEEELLSHHQTQVLALKEDGDRGKLLAQHKEELAQLKERGEKELTNEQDSLNTELDIKHGRARREQGWSLENNIIRYCTRNSYAPFCKP